MNEQSSPEVLTVFTADSWESNTTDACHGFSLDRLIEYFTKWGATPIAWVADAPCGYGGTGKLASTLLPEAIAAGRVINLIDGKYVALGSAQGEPIAPTFYCAAETIKPAAVTYEEEAARRELAEAAYAASSYVEKVRAPLQSQSAGRYDPFKDFKVKRDTATPDHAYSHPLTRVADAGAQVGPTHGSVWVLVR